jgi:transcription antitermination protein NusB
VTTSPAPKGGPPARRPAAEGPRREARERALSLLYESEIKHVPVSQVVEALAAPPDPFALALIDSVTDDQDRIDRLVADASVGWELDRMPVLDRSLLRLGTAELVAFPEIPVAVVIDEAVELAKRFSTEQSGGFVNGVLATIAHEVRRA